jgi:3',5'-nucleoside bisphosphate phosphatase
VELSVHLGSVEVHLLGLHIRDVEALQGRLEIYRGFRRRRAEEMVARLVAAGVPVTFEAVLAEAAGGAIGRPHVARALLAAGHVRDMREAFDKWLGAGRPAYVDKERLDIADGIRLIHETGGIAVWAHPGNDGRREQVEPLVAAGLDGIEVRHPSHSREDELRLASLAAFFGLVVSGGSDWHGAMHGGRVLGAMQVPHTWLELQDRRVRERRGHAGH